MLKKLIFGSLVVFGLCATANQASAQHYHGGPYYGGYRGGYYGHPHGGYYPRYYAYPAYRPYYGYGYRYYAPAPYYPAPYYYGPRVGVTYVQPNFGISVGF